MAMADAKKSREQWILWLANYGLGKFYDSFLRSAQYAESTCTQCRCKIYLDIVEGGGVPDWRTEDGDYGCYDSPDTNSEGTGGHKPVMLRNRFREK